jgi:hypothetical protein
LTLLKDVIGSNICGVELSQDEGVCFQQDRNGLRRNPASDDGLRRNPASDDKWSDEFHFLPRELLFSTFVSLVVNDKINIDDFPVFKEHMGHLNFYIDLKENEKNRKQRIAFKLKENKEDDEKEEKISRSHQMHANYARVQITTMLSKDPVNRECAFKFLSTHGFVKKVTWDKGAFKSGFPGLEDDNKDGHDDVAHKAYKNDFYELVKKFPMTYEAYRASTKKKDDDEQRKLPEWEQKISYSASYDTLNDDESDDIVDVDESASKPRKAFVLNVDDEMADAVNMKLTKKLFPPAEVQTTPSKSLALRNRKTSKEETSTKRKLDEAEKTKKDKSGEIKKARAATKSKAGSIEKDDDTAEDMAKMVRKSQRLKEKENDEMAGDDADGDGSESGDDSSSKEEEFK